MLNQILRPIARRALQKGKVAPALPRELCNLPCSAAPLAPCAVSCAPKHPLPMLDENIVDTYSQAYPVEFASNLGFSP